jgi:hypothetical protein
MCEKLKETVILLLSDGTAVMPGLRSALAKPIVQ